MTGAGFAPNPPATNGTRAPLSGTFGGAYVIFGKFADTWKPSEGAPSSARKVGDQKWVGRLRPNVAGLGRPGGRARPRRLVLPHPARVNRTLDANPGNYGIYTYAGSGAVYAPFETFTPITFDHGADRVRLARYDDLEPSTATP